MRFIKLFGLKKFLIRFMYHLAILLFISIPMQLLGMVLLAVFLSLAALEYKLTGIRLNKLPRVLKWFDNADIYPETGRNPVTYLSQVMPKGFLYQYYWLAIRNPCNYFGYNVLGKRTRQVIALSDGINSDLDVGDTAGKKPGFRYIEVFDILNDNYIYEYYYIKPYTIFGMKKCIRFRMGYKLGTISKTQFNTVVEQVFVFTPYHSYEGE